MACYGSGNGLHHNDVHTCTCILLTCSCTSLAAVSTLCQSPVEPNTQWPSAKKGCVYIVLHLSQAGVKGQRSEVMVSPLAQVFSWGSSSHGQLGHGDTLKKSRPVQIATLADKSIVSVVCGQYHTLALDDDQRLACPLPSPPSPPSPPSLPSQSVELGVGPSRTAGADQHGRQTGPQPRLPPRRPQRLLHSCRLRSQRCSHSRGERGHS